MILTIKDFETDISASIRELNGASSYNSPVREILKNTAASCIDYATYELLMLVVFEDPRPSRVTLEGQTLKPARRAGERHKNEGARVARW